jgi:outer membrane protein assembly factor BamA
MRARWFLIPALLFGATSGTEAGERVVWGHVALETTAPVDTAAWFEALDLEGRPVESAPLDEAVMRALGTLARRGYPFAEARPGDFDYRDGRLVGSIRLDPGVRARIAGLQLDGAHVTRNKTALRLSGLRIGQPYTGVEDRKLRERLLRSGLFVSVGEVEIVPGMEADEIILKVSVKEPPFTRFRGVLGVSGRESGLTGLLDLDLGNIAGTAREATGRWENRGNGLTRYFLHYREPWLPIVPIGLSGDLSHDINEGVYSYTRWEIRGDLSWKNQWTITFGRGGSQAVQPLDPLGRTTEGFTMVGLGLDRRNSLLNPTAGFRLAMESRRGTKTFPLSDSVSVRVDRTRWSAAGEGYLRLNRRWLAAVMSRFDYLDTPEPVVPRYELYAVGGAASLRGYREEQFLTPAAWVVQSELRWLQDDQGSSLYLFGDAGFIAPRTSTRFSQTFDQFVVGTGVGVRQASKLGILGVEYGFAKGENVLDGRVHLRIDAMF